MPSDYPKLPTLRSRQTDFPQCTFPKYVAAVISGIKNGTIPAAPSGRGRPRMELEALQTAIVHGDVTENSSCAEIMRHITWVREV